MFTIVMTSIGLNNHKITIISTQLSVISLQVDYKRCSLCKEFKLVSEFHIYKQGRSCWCKVCKKIRDKEYYDKNKKVICERQLAYARLEENKAHRKEYEKMNRKSITKRKRDYMMIRRKKLREETPMLLMTEHSLQKHRQDGCEVAIGLLEVIRDHICSIEVCAYCGLPFDWSVEKGVYNPFYPTLDRVYNSTKMTHVWEGPDDLGEGAVAVVHHRCNSMKSSMSLTQLAEICEGIAKWNKNV
jgi:hypothetical protein